MTAEPTAPIRWPAEALWQALVPVLPGLTIEVLPEIDSTNSELMRRFRRACVTGAGNASPGAEPIVLVAEQQTAGRGRLGRHWQSTRADSLTFSLGLPLQPADWSGLSLVVGISVAESLNPAPASGQPHIGLKWPNDLWLCGAPANGDTYTKLGGILVETASWEGRRYAVIGVGINIRPVTVASEVGSPAAVPPGCLQALSPGLEAPDALLRLLPPLVEALQTFARFGFAPFRARFAARDVLSGQPVQLSDGTQGTAQGVGEQGALLVHTPAGMKEISSAEVSVRPLAPDPGSGAAHALRGERPC